MSRARCHAASNAGRLTLNLYHSAELLARKGAFAKLWQKQISSEVELAAMAEGEQPEQKE